MVRPKLVRHLLGLTEPVEQMGVSLDFPTRVREHQVVASAQGFEEVGRNQCRRHRLFILISLFVVAGADLDYQRLFVALDENL